MRYGIELHFDKVSTSVVKEVWSQLAVVSQSDYMVSNGIYPHISLAVLDNISEPEQLREMLEVLSQEILPEPLKDTGIAYFESQKPVVYLGFTKGGFLSSIHAGVEGVLETLGVTNHEYYQQNTWTPHCTLGMEFGAEKLDAVVSMAKTIEWNVPFCVDEIRLTAYSPTEDMRPNPLGK